MNKNCEVIRDLLPLYADDACSEESRRLVEGHLAECPDCSGMLQRLKNNEIENGLQMEKQDVIEYGAKQFRKQSATVGSTVSGVLLALNPEYLEEFFPFIWGLALLFGAFLKVSGPAKEI